MLPQKRRKSVTFDLPEPESSDEEPLSKKIAKSGKISDDSSSESDIEAYLQPSNKIDLNSLLLEVEKSKTFVKSSSSSDDSDSEQETPATSESKIRQLREYAEYTEKMAEARKFVAEYEARRKAETEQTSISSLLAAVEGARSDVLDANMHSSDFESCSESDGESWKEVEEERVVPQGELEITVEIPGRVKKKKKEDFHASIKRRINNIRKKNQVLVHKVHLLCWIAHGNHLNSAINSKRVLAVALSLVPSHLCKAPKKIDVKHLEKVLEWFKGTVSSVGKAVPNTVSLQNLLQLQMNRLEAWNQKMLIYIFVAILRSLNVQCRLVLSFQVEPVRPPSSELCSLSTKNKPKTEEATISPNPAAKERKPRARSTSSASSEHNRAYNLRSQTKVPQLDGANDTTTSDDEVFEKTVPVARKKQKLGLNRFKIKLKSVNDTDSDDDFVVRSPFVNRNKDSPSFLVRTKQQRALKTLEVNTPKTPPETKKQTESQEANATKTPPNATRSRKTSNKEAGAVRKLRSSNRKSETESRREDGVIRNEPKPETESQEVESGVRKRRFSARKNQSEPKQEPQEVGDGVKKKRPGAKKKEPKQEVEAKPKQKTESHEVEDAVKKERFSARKKEAEFQEVRKTRHSVRKSGSEPKQEYEVKKKNEPKQEAESQEAEDTARKRESSAKKKTEPRKEIGKPKTRSSSSAKAAAEEAASTKNRRTSEDDFKPSTSATKRKLPVKKPVIAEKKEREPVDVWVEVFLEAEARWVCVDVTRTQINCVEQVSNRATQPIVYAIAWNNDNFVKDVSSRYCQNFNTATRVLRIDAKWWSATLKPFLARTDELEDEELEKKQLNQPLPKTIKEYKNHPLYVLKRHLLKYEAIYPPDAPALGFCRGEPVYSRQCVFILHPRYLWLKKAKVVKPGEKAYKIVKGRPRWDKLSRSIVTDPEEDVFGPWQVQDYEPPIAENGVVPRNEYGNVELYKPCMLPKKTVHLRLPGLSKVAKRMGVDCAPAFTGFNYSEGWIHPAFDGFVVCEEFEDVLVAAWELEQEEIEKREQERIDKRVYGNWKLLIKGLLIREKLKAKYAFGDLSSNAATKKRAKGGPKFATKKQKK